MSTLLLKDGSVHYAYLSKRELRAIGMLLEKTIVTITGIRIQSNTVKIVICKF